jgi:hypothetical protein
LQFVAAVHWRGDATKHEKRVVISSQQSLLLAETYN